MTIAKKTLSVAQVAWLCGVAHSTVGYWIRTKKLAAIRAGRNYSVSLDDLFLLMQSTGRKMPEELLCKDGQVPRFRTMPQCWQYWQDSEEKNCQECAVFVNKLNVCFTANGSNHLNCKMSCGECQYYVETYLPRMQFIHQIRIPAAIYRGFHVWGGNKYFSQLCGIQRKHVPGMGVERIVHPDSLEEVISNIKMRALKDPSLSMGYSIFLKDNKHGKLKVRIGVYPLDEPPGTHLVVGEPQEGE
ncbi:MAG: helix-turn-helix domain-containing protein [Deltaproteobacteria bacterium]|nr:helix-turn-helix domain-containing protein [Deltaproteobacteria bacterium]